MNDFTEEELSLLHDCTIIAINEYDVSKEIYDLQNKIQSMIDNYCKHQDRVASSDEDGHMVVQCGRCNYVLWHEKN